MKAPDITVDEGQIRTFLEIIHNHAKLAFDGIEHPGFLQIDKIHPSNPKKVFTEKFQIGDVDHMVAAAVRHARAGYNVYTEGRTVHEGVKKRGTIADTVGVFALVVDDDGDKGKPAAPNGSAGIVVESSPPANRHPWILIAPAIPAERAKSLGDALRAKVGGDADTGVVTQFYRVPGTPNLPNAEKVLRGRVPVPTRILEHTGKVWTADELAQQFPPVVKRAGNGVDHEGGGAVPPKLLEIIQSGVGVGRRSDQFYGVVKRLKRKGWSADAVEELLARHPDGIAAKFRDRLRQEVDRCFGKADAAGGVATPSESGLPKIYIVKGQLPRITDEAERALIAADLPIFSRAGVLMRPVAEVMDAADGHMTVVTVLRELCPDILVDYLAQTADFQKFDARSDDWIAADPPHQVARTLLVRQGHWHFSSIAGVITTPTLRPDGSLIIKPGYDRATRLYLDLDPALHLPVIPDEPTKDDAKNALKILRALLKEFPFAGPVDRAVALSGILTVLVRAALPVAPLHAIRASDAGSGKSYLIDLISTILTGRRCPVIAAGQDEAETEKRLGGMLLAGVPILSIDNVVHDLGGSLLCQASERPIVSLRPLGRSEIIEVVAKTTLFANGNNLVMSGDMSRRTIRCRLDPGVERPELRDFKFDPIARATEDRGHCIAAGLAIVRAYKAAGSPKVCGTLGSYEKWSSMVRAALVWLGESDPVDSMEAVRAEDPELAAIRELFSHWNASFHPHEGHTAHRIAEFACERYGNYGEIGGDFNQRPPGFKRPDFRELLLRIAGDGGAVSTRRLGKWLMGISGRIVDGHRLTMRPSEGHGNTFGLSPAR